MKCKAAGDRIRPTIIQFLEGSFTVQHRTDVAQMLPNLQHATQQSKLSIRKPPQMDIKDDLKTVLEELIEHTFDKVPWIN